MIVECREYLLNTLQGLDIRGRIFTDFKELKTSNATDFGSVIFQGETPERSTEHRKFQMATGEVRRFKIFDRKINFTVGLGSRSARHTEALYEQFLAMLKKEMTNKENNHIGIEVGNVEWIDKNDSILQSELLVQIDITFLAGLYRDHVLSPAPAIGTD